MVPEGSTRDERLRLLGMREQSSPGEARRSTQWRTAAIVLSVATLATALWLAFDFFDEPALPTFPLMTQSPEPRPKGTIVYGEVTLTVGVACVFAVDASASTEPRRLLCEGDPSHNTRWGFTEQGDVVIIETPERTDRGEQSHVTVVRTNGEVLEQFDTRGDEWANHTWDERLYTHITELDSNYESVGDGDSDHTWVATDDKGENRILEVRSPKGYMFASAERSPDRRWILLTDSLGRVLIADNAGTIRQLLGAMPAKTARFGASSNGGPNWFQVPVIC